VAFPSLKTLGPWCTDLVNRYKQLREWLFDMVPPAVMWLGGLFNPKSFLTSLLLKGSRAARLSLDQMILCGTVTDKLTSEVTHADEQSGVHVSGLFLQGAQWKEGHLHDSVSRELQTALPLVTLQVLQVDKAQEKYSGCYECPVYYTSQRGGTYVFSLHMRHPERPGHSGAMAWATSANMWTFRGVAVLLNSA
jgi:dynein heavy chain